MSVKRRISRTRGSGKPPHAGEWNGFHISFSPRKFLDHPVIHKGQPPSSRTRHGTGNGVPHRGSALGDNARERISLSADNSSRKRISAGRSKNGLLRMDIGDLMGLREYTRELKKILGQRGSTLKKLQESLRRESAGRKDVEKSR